MGSILTLATSKGGGGKTSTCRLLAANLAALGYRITVIDADRNASFSRWYADYYEGPTIDCLAETDHIRVVDRAIEIAEMADVVAIDTAGFENLTAAAAMSVAGFVLIPSMPDRDSIREAIRTSRQVGSLGKAARRTIAHGVLIVRWHGNGLVERAALDDLAGAGIPTLASRVPDLVDVQKSTYSGRVAVGGKIGRAVDRLINELVEKGGLPDYPAISEEEVA